MPYVDRPLPDDFEIPAIVPRKKPPGKPKGAVAKVTRDLKNGIIDAAVALGRDGEGEGGLQGYLQFLGWRHPKAFASLLGKMLPLQLSGGGGGSVSVSLNVQSIPSGSFLSAEDIMRLQPEPLQIEHEQKDDLTAG